MIFSRLVIVTVGLIIFTIIGWILAFTAAKYDEIEVAGLITLFSLIISGVSLFFIVVTALVWVGV